jgi:peptide/nickel transport system permease protein
MSEQAATLPQAGTLFPGRPSALRRAARTARRHPEGVFGLIVLLGFVFLGLFGEAVAPYPPRDLAVGPPLEGPSWDHPFGLNSLGQDILSRVIAGARI